MRDTRDQTSNAQHPGPRLQHPTLGTRRSAPSTLHSALVAVLLITLGGLGLRMYAIGHGLPYQYVPDESTMVGGALRMGAARSLQPSTFIYPAGLMYLFAAEYLGLLGVGRLVGLFSSVAQFREYAFTDPTLFYLLPRLAMALAGTVTIPVAYLLGKRLYGPWAGVAAAALVATSIMHVQMSHQARHWVPVSLLALAVLWVSLDLAGRGRPRDYRLAGLLVGLAAAISYNGLLLLVLPVAAHLIRLRGVEAVAGTAPVGKGISPFPTADASPVRGVHPLPYRNGGPLGLGIHLPLGQTLLLAPAAFFALNPYVLLQFNQFLSFQSDTERSIAGQIGDQLLEKQAFGFFAQASVAYEPAITLLGIVGAGLAVRQFRATALLVLLYPLFHYLVFSIMVPSMEQRYMLPALVLWALPAGLAVQRILTWLHSRLSVSTEPAPVRGVEALAGTDTRRPARASSASGGGRVVVSGLATAAAALLLAALVSIPSMRYDWLLSQTDTRTLAMEWIEATLSPGSDVAVESYPPPLTPDLDTLRAQQQAYPGSLGARDLWLLDGGMPPRERAYRLARLNLVDTSPTVDNISPYLAAHRHRFFVVTDFRWKSGQKGHQALKAYLDRNGRRLQLFSPSGDADYTPSDILNNMEDPLMELWRVERPGPKIEIYEVSP